MNIIFRVDASTEIGGGHLVRCLSLASELRALGAQCMFACCADALRIIPWFASANFPIICIPDSLLGDPVAEADLIAKQCGQMDMLVIDHYSCGLEFERTVKAWIPLVVAIEDIPARFHDVDAIIDPTYGRQSSEYASVAPGAKIFAGADYALLRPGFAAIRQQALARREELKGRISNILVAFGASDPENYTSSTLEILSGISGIKIDVVVGGDYPHLMTIEQLAQRSGGTMRIWQGREDMEQLMSQSDLAIGGAGGQSWERCCLGLPCLLVIMAENQRDVAAVIAGKGAGMLLGKGPGALNQGLLTAIRMLMRSAEKMMEMSRHAAALCDGMGAGRAAQAIFQLSGKLPGENKYA